MAAWEGAKIAVEEGQADDYVESHPPLYWRRLGELGVKQKSSFGAPLSPGIRAQTSQRGLVRAGKRCWRWVMPCNHE